MKYKNDDTVTISKQIIDAITRDKLASEITSHERCKNLNNLEYAINYFINDYHYTWNEEKKQFCTHLREGEIAIPDGRTVHEHLDGLLSDPKTACLLATRAEVERYERPKCNPWIKGADFSLKKQAAVLKHEPELAKRWRHEGTTINAEVPK
jgi:hypothetical protein